MSGFLARAFEQRSVSLTSPPEWLVEYLGGGSTAFTGESISVEGALNVTSVLAGFTILMEDIASLPLILYRRLERGKERAVRHPYYSLLHDNFNPEHTSMVMREMITGHMVGWGNFYGQMIWDGRGVVREIWPLAPNRMEVFREDGERRYLYTETNGARIAFRQEDILHIPAFGFDGLVGYSRVSLARNAIGLARSAEKYGSKMFANDARPSVLFKSQKKLSPEARNNLRESWNQLYAGAGNAGKSAVLEEGLDFETIGFPPEDAQFLQTRQFQVSEIARIFRIPPHMLGDVDRSTSWGSGIEQQELSYLNHTLRPWMVRVEQQMHKDLLIARERKNYIIEHLTDAMLRTDTAARFEAYAKAITNGWMNRNEVRERENLNPDPALDEFLIPLNMTDTSEPSSEPAPEPAPDLQQNALIPLFEDAMQRILKREGHEVQDAARRWLEKDKPDKFDQWLDQFYEQDQPAYIREIFAPFVRAGLLDQDNLTHFAAAHGTSQGMRVTQAVAEQHDLERIATDWLDLTPGLTAALMNPAALQSGMESEL